MNETTAFLQGMERLAELDQLALNKWVHDLFKFGATTYFSDYLINRDGYPSVVADQIFRACDKIKNPELKKRLCLSIRQLVENSLLLEPIQAYDLLLTVNENKVTDAADAMIDLINSGQLKRIQYRDINLQHAFLMFLPALYQDGKPGSPEEQLDIKIKNTLQSYLNDNQYAEVCRDGLATTNK